jgi:2-keto-4-pentenoate hydratase/2-oxohepta-3-ene-1,7-dioic acid hydratase in catechol pathway
MGDVDNLSMELRVNGDLRQNGNTRFMVFKPAHLVYYLSQFMTLEAGDLISTGTPAGVALGMTPPAYLKKGDVAELTIAGLGTQKQQYI